MANSNNRVGTRGVVMNQGRVFDEKGRLDAVNETFQPYRSVYHRFTRKFPKPSLRVSIARAAPSRYTGVKLRRRNSPS
jgi:hypothetical protein